MIKKTTTYEDGTVSQEFIYDDYVIKATSTKPGSTGDVVGQEIVELDTEDNAFDGSTMDSVK